jgi:hypothetical protein
MTWTGRDIQVTLLALTLFLVVVPAFAAPAEPESIPQISLTELLANRFGNLSQTERRLAAAAEIGEATDCTDLSGGDKMIRADLLAWLCTDPHASAQVTLQNGHRRGLGIPRQFLYSRY